MREAAMNDRGVSSTTAMAIFTFMVIMKMRVPMIVMTPLKN